MRQVSGHDNQQIQKTKKKYKHCLDQSHGVIKVMEKRTKKKHKPCLIHTKGQQLMSALGAREKLATNKTPAHGKTQPVPLPDNFFCSQYLGEALLVLTQSSQDFLLPSKTLNSRIRWLYHDACIISAHLALSHTHDGPDLWSFAEGPSFYCVSHLLSEVYLILFLFFH